MKVVGLQDRTSARSSCNKTQRQLCSVKQCGSRLSKVLTGQSLFVIAWLSQNSIAVSIFVDILVELTNTATEAKIPITLLIALPGLISLAQYLDVNWGQDISLFNALAAQYTAMLNDGLSITSIQTGGVRLTIIKTGTFSMNERTFDFRLKDNIKEIEMLTNKLGALQDPVY